MSAGEERAGTAYVETAEPMEGEDWTPWYYAMCGDCGWEGTGYALMDYAQARAEATAHVCSMTAHPREPMSEREVEEAHPYAVMGLEALAKSELGLIQFAYGNGPPSNEDAKAWPPRVAAAWFLATEVLALQARFRESERAREDLTHALSFYADFEESGHSDWSMATDTLVAHYGSIPQPGEPIPPLVAPEAEA